VVSLADAPTVALAPRTLAVGALFADRYEVISMLGEGGMGAVYRVLDHELGEHIALKILREEIADTDGALDRFRREAKLARRVTHPNVARTYDLGAFDGVRFLTMELIDGEPLSHAMQRKGRIELVEALRVAAEIARGLAAAHAVGVVHRDLKPDNVMLSGTRVVITDFGIARQTGVIGDAAQSLGLVLGTPAYMAPEQVEGRELDGRADIYALGIVLYQLLTGELPFVGDTPFAIAAARLHGDPPDPSHKDPSLPPAIISLVKDAMARRRDGRPDAQAILARLDELRAGRFEQAPVFPTPVSRLEPSMVTTVAVVPFTGDLTIAAPLTDALGDALCALRNVRVAAPGAVGSATSSHLRDGVLDPSSLARAVDAKYVVSGTVRISGDVARIAVRLFNAAKSAQEWAERFDMNAEPFAIEDRVVGHVIEALRSRVEGERRVGPSDPVAADMYKRGRELYASFVPSSVIEAVKLLEEAHVRFSGDSWIASALAAALVRSWMFQTTTDSAVVKRAEEMALRSLAADPSRGEALVTIGIIRWQFGELAAAARAFEDAVSRTPTLSEAHEYLGQMLGESGHPHEALRHLELAVRFDLLGRNASLERVRIYDLLGDTESSRRELAALANSAGPMIRAFAPFRSRVWHGDKEGVRATRDDIAKQGGAEAQYYVPMIDETLKAMSREPFVDVFRQMADASHASLRRRSYFYQISAEMNAVAGKRAEALDSLERASDVLLFDVLWLDRCPMLDSLRDDPRFARSRAVAGSRAASIWSRS